jgi:enoyl-CoA hydratase/carnithine racemase
MTHLNTIRERVRIELDDNVATVVLDRPDKRNGLDMAMFEALVEAGEQLAGEARARAVVLRGEGQAFCAGLDFKAVMANPKSAKDLLRRPEGKVANIAQQMCWTWRELPVPVIAAIHGHCLGGGFQLALGADLRFATADAQLSAMEMRLGLIPDMSISKTLLPLVRPDVAAELIYTGKTVSGQEAAELGLVTRVVDDPVATALETAQQIASRSPRAVRAAKRLLRDAPEMPLREAFLFETELQLELLGSPEQMQAAMAHMTKQPAKFSDPTL